MFVRRFNPDSGEKLDDKELVNQALYMTAYLYEGSDIYPDQFEPDKKID